MLIAISISILALMVGRKIFSALDQMHLWTSAQGQKFYLAFLCIQLLCFWLQQRETRLLWITQSLLLLLPFFVFFAQERIRRARFARSIVSILDFLSLQMRSGNSLRESLQMSLLSFPNLKYELGEILSLFQFDTKSENHRRDPLFREVCRELVNIHQGANRATERLRALRNKLKVEQDFRRKSAQVTAQIRTQAGVLLVLFMALLAFVLLSHTWSQVQSLVLIAGVLFMIGLSALFWIPRTFKWKV